MALLSCVPTPHLKGEDFLLLTQPRTSNRLSDASSPAYHADKPGLGIIS